MTKTRSRRASRFLTGALWAARLAHGKLGEDVVILDVRRETSVSDYFVFVTATSVAHMRALEDTLRVDLRKRGFRPSREEGRSSETWRVLDYGGFLVHLFRSETREFYGLERLWHEARPVQWNRDSRKG